MHEKIDIREGPAGPRAWLQALYPRAFPGEDLRPLVDALLAEGAGVVSLAAHIGKEPVAHLLFTACSVEGSDSECALLGPLAVAPEHQGEGIGTALVEAGLERMRDAGVARVFVLGDPAYYGRFAFAPERGVAPPYPLPAAWSDAWQSCRLGAADAALTGTLSVPLPWRDRALWGP